MSAIYSAVITQIGNMMLWANAAIWTWFYFRWETPTKADTVIKTALLIFSSYSVFAVIKTFFTVN